METLHPGSATRQRIDAALEALETHHAVQVLYAVESGSRAWGFASQDSDWDVRFLYLHPPAWYLSIRDRREVIEQPLDAGLDVSGWDLRKALRLFAKSNPPLFEWLRSPLVYREVGSAAARMRAQGATFFSLPSCLYHYLHMAERNYRAYFQHDVAPLKKYFYVMRPVLACCWGEAEGTMPPMEFDVLVAHHLPAPLRPLVEDLLARKRAGEELDVGPRLPALDAFLEERLHHFHTTLSALPRPAPPDLDQLDALFQACLAEIWGDRL